MKRYAVAYDRIAKDGKATTIHLGDFYSVHETASLVSQLEGQHNVRVRSRLVSEYTDEG
jgi:hypothetical protein